MKWIFFTVISVVLSIGYSNCGKAFLTSSTPADSQVQDPSTNVATPATTPMVSAIKLPPHGKFVWDWQIGASSEAAIVPPKGIVMIDVDGFNTSANKIAELKAQGIYTICYINAGSWEPNRPDSAQYPEKLKIAFDTQWNEWFLDIKDVLQPNSVLARLLNARLQMCKDKGFDALEPDNLQNDENTGGKVSLQEQLDFNGWLADAAHKVGLAIFQKNGPDKILKSTTSGELMIDKFDGIINEECGAFGECASLHEFVKRGKPVMDIEYLAKNLSCATATQYGFNMILKPLKLPGATDAGYSLQTCP